MTHNVFYWLQVSTSGGAQVDQGPFHVGSVNKLLKVESRGQKNSQVVPLSTTGVIGNSALWAMYYVHHGSGPLNIVTSADTDQFLFREQESGEQYQTAWAPQTTVPGEFGGFGVNRTWRGQSVINDDLDFYMSWALPFGGSWVNWNSFGNLRVWWV